MIDFLVAFWTGVPGAGIEWICTNDEYTYFFIRFAKITEIKQQKNKEVRYACTSEQSNKQILIRLG